jgi:AcrR family transcriptional regulator
MDAPARGRPRVSSRGQIEQIALDLFLRDGYAVTTMPAIAAAAAVSRTSVFRYFRTKSDIVWWAFDAHLDEFAALLRASEESVPVLDAVRSAILRAVQAVADDEGVWLHRFALIDTEPELRTEEAAHWLAWAAAISAFLQSRLSTHDPVISAAIGGALQSAYVARLRIWLDDPADVPIAVRLDELDASLRTLCAALQSLIDEAPAAA